MPRKRIKPIILNEIPKEDIDENGFVRQFDYLGNEQSLKASVYCNKLICQCGNPRYYKNQDKKQILSSGGLCKVCLRKRRLEGRRSRLKSKVIREVLEDAL